MASSDCLVKQLLFGSVNVCGLKRRLDYPEFVNTICKYDILCFTETKLDSTDVVSVPGFNFLSQHLNKIISENLAGLASYTNQSCPAM